MDDKQITYTISDFADIVGVTRQTVHRWINLGIVKVVDLSGGWRRIPDSEIDKFKGE